MAVISLQTPVQWGWDTTTSELVLRLRQLDDNDPDAEPTREAVVRFAVASINIHDIP